jgi:hypothetical protein
MIPRPRENWDVVEDIPGPEGVDDLPPRMTERKHEKVWSRMGFFQSDTLKPDV